MKGKKFLKGILSVCLFGTLVFTAANTAKAETVTSYNVDAAVSYAKKHVNDSKQDCIQFVRGCFEAGGVKKDENRKNGSGTEDGYKVSEYIEYLTTCGYADLIELQTKQMNWYPSGKDWYVPMSANSGKLSVGDGVIYKCEKCNSYFHASIVTGVNEDGYALYYAQNRAVENKPLCKIKCVTCKADKQNITLYSLHLKTAAGGYDSSYNSVKVTGLKAEHADDNNLKLSWDAAKDADGYYIFRRSSKSNYAYDFYKETSGTSITCEKPEFSGVYNYIVRPYRVTGGTTYVGAASEACLYYNTPVVTVEKDSATGKPVIKWTKVAGATSYQVFKSANGKDTWYPLYTASGAGSYTYKDADSSKWYYMVEASKSGVGYKRQSEPVAFTYVPKTETAKIKTPTNVKVSVVSSTGKLKVSWNKVTGAEKYEVYRSTSGKAGTYYRLILTSKTSVTHSGATSGSRYYYKVRAVDTDKNVKSAFSKVVSGVAKFKKTTIKVTYTSAGKPKITWNKVPGAKYYRVYRSSTGKAGTFYSMITTTKTSCIHSGAKKGTTYYYMVRAVNPKESAAIAPYSNIVAGKPKK